MRRGGIGDFILSLPLLSALSSRCSEVCLITKREYLDLLPHETFYTHFLNVDGAALQSLYRENGPSRELVQYAEGAAVYLFGKRDTATERSFYQAGAETVYWLNPRPRRPPHIARRFFLEAEEPLPPDWWQIRLSGDAESDNGEHLWLHPGSGSDTKNVKLKMFLRLAHGWYMRHGRKVWLSFGPADTHLFEPMTELLSEYGIPFNYLYCPELQTLIKYLQAKTRVFIGNDSGISHLAAYLGKPTVAMFRSTDPQIWRPLGNCVVLPPEGKQGESHGLPFSTSHVVPGK